MPMEVLTYIMGKKKKSILLAAVVAVLSMALLADIKYKGLFYRLFLSAKKEC